MIGVVGIEAGRRIFRALTASVVGALITYLHLTPAHAEVIPAKGNPKRAEVTLAKTYDTSKPVLLYYISPGNESVSLEVSLSGPPGTHAVLEMAKIRGAPLEHTVRSLPGGFKVTLDRSLRVATAPMASVSPESPPIPEGCTPEQYQLYLDLIASAPELSGITPEQYCSGFGSAPPEQGDEPEGGDGPEDFKVTGTGMLRKDACTPPQRSRYLIRLRVDLSGVELKDEVKLRALFRERPYPFTKASTIKPVSDGRFAPSPLLLMSTVAPYQERVFFTRWKRNRPGPVQELRIEDYVPYMNLTLSRSIISSLLTGRGVGTFEIIGGSQGYGVCFALRRERQSRNGYPIGSDDG